VLKKGSDPLENRGAPPISEVPGSAELKESDPFFNRSVQIRDRSFGYGGT